MNIGIIGDGAIGGYVRKKLAGSDIRVRALLLLPEELKGRSVGGDAPICVSRVDELPADIDLMVDCAGHLALREHGPGILRRGTDLATVSIGALADRELVAELERAASEGGARLKLASGSIGALDCLRAAGVGTLRQVTYTGRKPPRGWKGSPAESKIDLDELTDEAAIHFEGSARQAASEYPKNANVAAAVALSGIGFDETRVRLIADPTVEQNIHEVEASGDFGNFSFRIQANPLPDNPRSSALAAMSVVSLLEQAARRIGF